MNLFDDLMVDIETMGTSPNSALLSIGAVFFRMSDKSMGPTYLATVHLGSAVADGATMDPGTILWWLGQSDEARKGVRFGGRHIRTVLQEFSDFIATTCRHEDVRIWGNSPTMDCAIPRSAYERAGIPVPWYWSHERDFRTLRHNYPQVEYDTKDKGDGAHNALADAIFQVEHMFKIKDHISARK